MSEQQLDVLGIGEPMALFEVAHDGPLDRSSRFRLRMAGAEANLLIGVARLGHRPGLLSAVGADPFGALILRTLRDEGVDVAEVAEDPERPTGVFFKQVTGREQRRVFYYRDGSAASAVNLSSIQALERQRPRLVVVSGLTLGLGGPGGMGDTAQACLRRARELGIATVFDANLRSGLWEGETAAAEFAELRGCLDLVLAGREELEVLVQGHDAVHAARRLRSMDGCAGVIVKDGPEGSIVIDREGVAHIPALPVARVVDPVGAGDAFGAGVVAGWLRGWSLREAARLGSVLGGAVVARRGDWEGVPHESEARRLLAELPAIEVAKPVPGARTMLTAPTHGDLDA